MEKRIYGHTILMSYCYLANYIHKNIFQTFAVDILNLFSFIEALKTVSYFCVKTFTNVGTFNVRPYWNVNKYKRSISHSKE